MIKKILVVGLVAAVGTMAVVVQALTAPASEAAPGGSGVVGFEAAASVVSASEGFALTRWPAISGSDRWCAGEEAPSSRAAGSVSRSIGQPSSEAPGVGGSCEPPCRFSQFCAHNCALTYSDCVLDFPPSWCWAWFEECELTCCYCG